MNDKMAMPQVKNIVVSGKFTLNIYAYRRLTRNELLMAVAMYKREKHIKKLPASGSAKYVTLIGYNPTDDI